MSAPAFKGQILQDRGVVKALVQDSREGILRDRRVGLAEVKGKVCRIIRLVLVAVQDKVLA